MKVIKAPKYLTSGSGKPWLFTAGSIEMGEAEDWQTRITEDLKFAPGTILNPRRDDWDSSWEQSINNSEFRQQVEWELDALKKADVIALYFAPDTKSPISLFELGLFINSNIIVFCPEGFWRKGNVDIVCKRYKVQQAESWDAWLRLIYRAIFRAADA